MSLTALKLFDVNLFHVKRTRKRKKISLGGLAKEVQVKNSFNLSPPKRVKSQLGTRHRNV